jgi:hypothetical protein
MLIVETLAAAQGGKMVERVAAATGLSPTDTRKALEALCPSIAERVRESAAEPQTFEDLLSILDDNGGDLLDDGDVASDAVASDGETVLKSAYGSLSAAEGDVSTVAQALRLDANAIQRLAPIAAAVVLAILGKRYRDMAGPPDPSPESEEPQATREPAEAAPSRGGGLLATVIATAGAAAARAIVNRMLPRRRRRTTYRYSYAPRRRTRRRRRREPTLNDLFRGLLR